MAKAVRMWAALFWAATKRISLKKERSKLDSSASGSPNCQSKSSSRVPILRAKQTADIIAEKIGKPIEQSDLFVEWNQGAHRLGKNANDQALWEQSKALVETFKESNHRSADEENFEDLNRRAGDAIAYLLERPEENIAVVSHGWFSPVLVGKAIIGDDFTGRDCEHFIKTLRMKNTGLTVLVYDTERWWGGWNLLTWNDHAHLG